MENEIKVQRGEVWYLKFNDSVGFEESVGRPAVVVSSKEGLGTTPIIQVVYMTTTPKKAGYAVELTTPRKRSWALCNQIVSVDRSRFLSSLCMLSEQEMLRIELGLRKVLALPLKTDEFSDKVNELSEELVQANDKISGLEIEVAVHKRMYEKALDKIAELRFEKDMSAPEKPEIKPSEVYPVMEPPKTEKVVEPIKEVGEVAEEIEVDVEALKTQMGAIPKTEPKKIGRGAVKKHGLNRTSKPEEFIPYKTGDTGNVNTDEWYVIVANTGINIQVAQAIVSYRNKHGKFVDLVDLLNVPRFGVKYMNAYGNKLEV